MTSSILLVRQANRAVFRSLVADRPAIVFVGQGRKTVTTGGVSSIIDRGQIGVLPDRAPLSIENVPSGGRYIASALVTSDEAIEASRIPPGDPARTTDHNRTIAAFERAAAALDDPLAPLSIREHAVQEVLLWLAEDGIGFGARRAPTFADRLRAAIAAEPDTPWVAADAARAMAVSEATLRRRLSADGTTFGDLLADARMTHALGLLQTTDLPINRIALDVGYASPSRFANRFRARFGLPPSAIREQPARTVDGPPSRAGRMQVSD